MIQRCTNPDNPAWLNYGGAGVKVCDRWLNSFEAFLEDMGKVPSRGYTLGRYLDSGDYEPGNCSWQSRAEQGFERRGKTAAKAWHNRTRIRPTAIWNWKNEWKPETIRRRRVLAKAA